MNKPLRIISIDGTRGSGKTSQINMLIRHFKALGFSCLSLKIDNNDQTNLTSFQSIETFLDKDSKGIVVMDGSIARPMVTDLINGMSSVGVIDKYKHIMHDYEKLDKKYGIVGLLFIMDNISHAQNRLSKQSSLTGITFKNIEDVNQEKSIISGMRIFDHHIASKNIDFQVFNLEPTDSIMTIQKEVVDYLSREFNIPKLVKHQDDW